MDEGRSPTSDRRRFLSRIGATLAAGLGLSALASLPAGASRGHKPPAGDGGGGAGPDACAIYCYTYACSGGCAPGSNLFRCVDQCSGTWYYCLAHSCSNFCLSQNAC